VAPLPTVTLAEIYAAQGHRERAVETLRTLLTQEPDHAPARELLEELEAADYKGPRPRTLLPEDDAALDVSSPEAASAPSLPTDATAPGPENDSSAAGRSSGDDADVCVAIPVDAQTLFVYWETRERTRAHLEATRRGGALGLRVLLVAPTWDGPRTALLDLELRAAKGDSFVEGLPAGAVVRVALGWRRGEEFVPVACSPALEALRDEPGHLVRWTLLGAAPLSPSDRDAASIERAFGAAKARGERIASRQEASAP
jgi:hypothetical protein